MKIKEDLITELRNLGLKKDEEDTTFSIIQYVYIGQNIRNEGMLKSEKYLNENIRIIEFLIKAGVIETKKWYSLELYLLSNKGISIGEILTKELIETKGKEVIKSLEKLPQLLIGFLVNNIISDDLTFDLDYVYDWRDILLRNKRIISHSEEFFKILMKYKMAVFINDYVSTRGGEKRGKKYVISPEVRAFLESMYPIKGLSTDEIIEVKVLYLLEEILKDSKNGENCNIYGEDLRRTGNLKSACKFLEEELTGYQNSGMILNLNRTLSGNFHFEVLKKDEILQEIKDSCSEKVGKLIGKSSMDLFIEEEGVIDGPERKNIFNNIDTVSELFENKIELYKLIAQLSHGKSIFISNPNTEYFGIQLIETVTFEEELKDFIINLHQLIIESSANQILRFIDSRHFWNSKKSNENEISPKEFMDLIEEVKDEKNTKLFESSREILNDIHNLRNHYSHLQNSKRYYESSKIFKKLINIPFPDTDEEFIETQKKLFEKTNTALSNLCSIFEDIIRKRKVKKG